MDADMIAKGLYLGSVPRSCGPFDVVVLAAREYQDIPLPCLMLRAPLDDAKPTKREVQTALLAARKVHELRQQGNKVLVTCALGKNRSALIAALVLMMGGDTANQAIERILERRKNIPYGGTPLTNKAFVELLKRYEKAKIKR